MNVYLFDSAIPTSCNVLYYL